MFFISLFSSLPGFFSGTNLATYKATKLKLDTCIPFSPTQSYMYKSSKVVENAQCIVESTYDGDGKCEREGEKEMLCGRQRAERAKAEAKRNKELSKEQQR